MLGFTVSSIDPRRRRLRRRLGQVTFLKKQYVKTIEKRDDFLDVGFLLTDYASDFYDGKQITLCVYI